MSRNKIATLTAALEACDLLDHQDFLYDQPKIVALCIGWEDQPILKSIFNELTSENFRQLHGITSEMGYQLKFLFRDTHAIFEFIIYAVNNHLESRAEYGHFISPLIRRVRRDVALQRHIQDALVKTTIIAEKISFYQLLGISNALNENSIAWKKDQIKFKNKSGYNILSNRQVSLSTLLIH